MIIINFIFSVILLFNFNFNNNVKYYNHYNGIDIISISPNSIKIYHLINKYSIKYNIPNKYLFRVILLETGYKGPLHYKYNPFQTSYMGAEGPFQLMLSTAKYISNNKNLNKIEIRTNIELNINLATKYIRYLKDKYDNWAVVFAVYNTGNIKVNSYSKKIIF